MTRVRHRDYSKLTRNIKLIPTCFLHVCSNDPLESLQQRNKPGCFQASNNNEQVTGRAAGAARPLCKRGKPCPSATSACRSSAEDARSNAGGSSRPRHSVGAGLVVLLVALWTAPVHAGAAEGKLLAQRIIAESWPELVSACRLGLTLKPRPEWDTPPDGALRARCLNGAKSG